VSYRIITAFFPGRLDADAALERLSAMGVAHRDVSFIPKTVNRPDDIGLRTGTKACKGAALGGVIGGALGAFAGALSAAGAIVLPSLGTVLAGPLVAALAAAGALGTIGGLVGALAGARVPEFEATYLADAVAMGGSIIGVRCAVERKASIEDALETSGARRIWCARARSG
jgi:hypothetical protein